jgi:hypothetical protein
MSPSALQYPKTPRNTVNRSGLKRGNYDLKFIHGLVQLDPCPTRLFLAQPR